MEHVLLTRHQIPAELHFAHLKDQRENFLPAALPPWKQEGEPSFSEDPGVNKFDRSFFYVPMKKFANFEIHRDRPIYLF
jgi:hypothetical protein